MLITEIDMDIDIDSCTLFDKLPADILAAFCTTDQVAIDAWSI
jgi:hypothetical protein